MGRGKGYEHDESAWRNSPVGVLTAAKTAGPRGNAEAGRIRAVPSYTGLESPQLTDRDITVRGFACQANPGVYEGWNHGSSRRSLLAITPEGFDSRGPLILNEFRRYAPANESGDRCFA
jgi:hypothetical protein